MLPLIAGCAPNEADAVRWYRSDKASIDAFDRWLVAQVAALDPTVDNLGLGPTFQDACRRKAEALGAVGFTAAFFVGPLPPGNRPAHLLCPSFGVPGWTRGTSALANPAQPDGRQLGWGEYFDEAHDERRPGFDVYWRLQQGSVSVDVGVILPRP